MTPPRVIIVDWGTTAFRAWLMDGATGAILDHIPDGRGMRDLSGSSFRDYCVERLAPWRAIPPCPPIYMAGMVGAASGWAEAPQPPTPVDAQALAAGIIPAPDLENAWILPGVRVDTVDPDRVDVMRGEETQIIGALSLTGRTDATVCLPGTHSKWTRVRGGVIEDFATFMTGELHGVLMNHTILGLGCPAGGPSLPPGPAFDEGLAEAERAGRLLSHVFAARVRRLYRHLRPEGVSDFLSGLLIGEELSDARSRGFIPSSSDVLLVGATALSLRYARALESHGLIPLAVPSAAATQRGVLDLTRLHHQGTGS
ncbi:MAG: 2-dehydro-3-deoxygalactonokinase [Rhodospirillum sp.]|nr:2-dehydro-3-deoxygalactonokinase [Rhodospirillum sp.]MCF8489203.1 2-dehydro-3-deoxygalactonokinase [Rhodospirillum sp.]